MIGDRNMISSVVRKMSQNNRRTLGFGDETELKNAGSNILIAHPQQLLEIIR
jgi:phosphoglycolate phosphatase